MRIKRQMIGRNRKIRLHRRLHDVADPARQALDAAAPGNPVVDDEKLRPGLRRGLDRSDARINGKGNDAHFVRSAWCQVPGAWCGEAVNLQSVVGDVVEIGDLERLVEPGDDSFEFHTIISASAAARMMRTKDNRELSNLLNVIFIELPKIKDLEETIEKNIECLRTVLNTDKVCNTSDMINTLTGMSDTLNAIKKMMMILTAIVTAMIIVLMERSFISKEKSEIALMKAVGISNGSIIAQHTLRFVIVSILACGVALAALMPISNALMDFIFSMIGDISGMKSDINPIEIFVICPAMLILVTTIGAFLTALYTNTIKSSDTASIE